MWTWARRRAEPVAWLAAALLIALGSAGAPAHAATSEDASEIVMSGREVVTSNAAMNLQLEVRLNGAPRNLISTFRGSPDGGVIGATKAELAQIGFDPRKLQARPDGLVHLADVPGLHVRYDEAEQTIDFAAPPNLLATTRLDARGLAPAGNVSTTATPLGAVVNYTLFATGGQSGSAVAFQGASAEIDARLFSRFGVVSTSALAGAGPDVASGVTRLDTTWRYEQAERTMTYSAGDVITRGLSWSRPVRLGGLQVSRSFGLRPDLVTSPIPVISGTAAAPSSLDLYVNNVKQLSANVPAGPFEVSRAPLAYGAGMAQVVVRDALGRDTRIDLPFYASDALLAPGLADFALEAGYARRNFGVISNDYDRRLAASGSIRYGLTPKFTAEAHAEAAGGLVNGGLGAVVGVGRWAVASLAASGSEARGEVGGLFDLSIESRQRLFTISARMQRTVGDYQDLASWTSARGPPSAALTGAVITSLADPLYAAAFRAPRAVDQAVLSVPVFNDRTRLSLSYARLVRDDDRTRLLGLSMSHDFKFANVYLRALHDFDRRGSTTVSVGLSLPLGRGVYASGEVRSEAGGASVVAEAASRGAESPGDLGWRVRIGEGQTSDRLLAGTYVTSLGRAEAGVQQIDGRTTGYGQFSGGFAYVAGQPFLSRRLDGPFAVVDAGARGLPVRYENRLVGKTGRSGRLLIPNLVAYQPNRISIDPTYLPLDQDVAEDTAMVAPRTGAAAIVRLGWTTSSSALLSLVDGEGRAIEAGAEGRLQGASAAEDFFVGYDGEAYVSGLKAHNTVEIRRPGGRSCRASFAYRGQRGRQVRIGPAPCLPTLTAKPRTAAQDKVAAR